MVTKMLMLKTKDAAADDDDEMSQFLLLVGGVSNPFHQLPTIQALFGECSPGSGPRSKEVFEPKFSGNISQHIL